MARTRGYRWNNKNKTLTVGGRTIIDLSTADTVNALRTTGSQSGASVGLIATGDDTNIDILLSPKGAGKVKVNDEYFLPAADGDANQVIQTDGSGSLSFTTISTNSIAQGNSTVAVSDTGTGTITVTADGSLIATFAPTLALDISNTTNAVKLPAGTTGQRPAGANGMIRYNSSTGKIEGYTSAGGWAELGAGAASATVADAGDAVIGIGLNSKEIDSYSVGTYDSAFYYAVTRDETNDEVATHRYSVVHNGTEAFVSQSHIARSNTGNDFITVSAAVENGTVKLKALSTVTDINSVSYLRVPLGDNTTTVTAGKIRTFLNADLTTANTDVDDDTATGYSTSISDTTKLINEFPTSSYDTAIYYTLTKDETNNELSAGRYVLTHNGTTAYLNGSQIVNSNNSNDYPVISADISNDNARLRVTGVSATNSISYYRLGLGDLTVAESAGRITKFANADVDSATESLDTWSLSGARGAKYFITAKNTDTGAVTTTEVVVVHDDTTPYMSEYGVINSGASDVLTLTTDTNAGNVRLLVSASSANWQVTGYRILLADDENDSWDGSTAENSTRTVGAVTVSSSATEIDTIDTNNYNGAFYVVVGNSSSEVHASISEVTVISNGGTPYISTGPVLSTKGTDQLEFTATETDGTISLKAASSSGASTTVNAYRVHLLRDDAGASVVDSWSASSYRGAKYFISVNDETDNKLVNTEVLLVHDGTDAYVTQYNIVSTTDDEIITVSATLENGVVYLKALAGQARITGYRILLADNEDDAEGSNANVIGATTVSSSATALDTFITDEYTGAFYVVVGYNSTESAASISEVMVVANTGDDAYVAAGPTLSTKGTDQLEFTAGLSGTTVTLNAASTSGASTTVNAYRVHLLRGEGGEVAVSVTITENQTISGAKTFTSPTVVDGVTVTGNNISTNASNADLELDAAGTGAVSILTQRVIMTNLPTSDPSVAGQLWNNSGVLNISAG